MTRCFRLLTLCFAIALAAACSSESSSSTTTTTTDAGSTADSGTAGDAKTTADVSKVDGGTSTDATDNAACCAAKKAQCGTVAGCKGSCGQCPTGKTCNASNKCVTAPKTTAYGGSCGPNTKCPGSLTQSDPQGYAACLDGQCDEGLECNFGDSYYLNAGICTMPCDMKADDVNNATGAPGPDGIEDPDVTDSDCMATPPAASGPAGAQYRCVDGGQAGGAKCRAGTNFKPCKADSDCPATEACGFIPLNSKFQTVCVARWKGPKGEPGLKTGEKCGNGWNAAYSQGTCANNLCAATCVGFCKTDADCPSSMACKQGEKVFASEKDTRGICRPKKCDKDAECGAGFFCAFGYNDATSPNGSPDPADKTKTIYPAYVGECAPITANGAKVGQPCDSNPSNDTSGPSCEASFCIGGVCNPKCKADADCGNDAKCSTQQDIQDVGTDQKNPVYVSPSFDLCTPMPGADKTCGTQGDCAGNQACRLYTKTVNMPEASYLPVGATPTSLPNGATPTVNVLSSGGWCVTPGKDDLDWGAQCGRDVDTDGVCKGGWCAQFFGYQDANQQPLYIGQCAQACSKQSDCGKVEFDVGGGQKQAMETVCNSERAAWSPIDPYNPFNRVFVNICQPLFSETKNDCTATKKCATAGEACLPTLLATGPDAPAKADAFFCQRIVNDKDPAPTKKAGDACNPDPAAGPATCTSGLCWEDAKAGTGYCSALCASDADCGNGTVCDLKHQWLPRQNANNAAIVPICKKKKACQVCDYDFQCHSDLRCTHVTSGKTGSCAVPCSTDKDCEGSDGGGSKCEPAKDNFGKPIQGVNVCTPKC
jgi:hypothetical protein